jgi:hypothetical protein
VLFLVSRLSEVDEATKLVSDTSSDFEFAVFCPAEYRDLILESSANSRDFAEGENERLEKLSKRDRLDGDEPM